MTRKLTDGLEAFSKEFETKDVMRLIERTARWVDPATFRLLPVWYPEYARKMQLYNTNWTKVRKLKGEVDKREGNTQANKALTLALGLRAKTRPNWTCCHIWGVDDDQFIKANNVVQDHRFFSCVANMVLLPTPLKAFTDAMSDVKAMLRICARNIYGWHCDHESIAEAVEIIDGWDAWDAYPDSWPRSEQEKLPPGVMTINDDIRKNADRRLTTIKNDLVNAGPHYPRDAVREALDYWSINADAR